MDEHLDDGCDDTVLKVWDDSEVQGPLSHPGLKSSCGQGFLVNEIPISYDTVSVSFQSKINDGKVRFRLEVTALDPKVCPEKEHSGCPSGPCCEGQDCCVVTAGSSKSFGNYYYDFE